jgi:hypothetical protein
MEILIEDVPQLERHLHLLESECLQYCTTSTHPDNPFCKLVVNTHLAVEMSVSRQEVALDLMLDSVLLNVSCCSFSHIYTDEKGKQLFS